MPDDNGLIGAFILDRQGGASPCDWQCVRRRKVGDGFLWAHMDRKHASVQKWIRDEAGLDPIITAALLTEDTRPRATRHDDGALIILRGANLNPGAEPDDMISVRIWVEPGRVISLRSPQLKAVADVREAVEAGTGPRTEGQLIAAIADRLSHRLQPVTDNLEDIVDALEEQAISDETEDLIPQLSSIRRQCVVLRRYLSPQREALQYLRELRVDWIDEDDREILREVSNQTLRNLEDLDMVRERAGLIHEEVRTRQGERMNHNMYILAIVAAIFLPLGLLTGLLGINVGGMPGVDDPWAFYWVVGILLALTAVVLVLLKWKRLF
jgi:zinc transporter